MHSCMCNAIFVFMFINIFFHIMFNAFYGVDIKPYYTFISPCFFNQYGTFHFKFKTSFKRVSKVYIKSSRIALHIISIMLLTTVFLI